MLGMARSCVRERRVRAAAENGNTQSVSIELATRLADELVGRRSATGKLDSRATPRAHVSAEELLQSHKMLSRRVQHEVGGVRKRLWKARLAIPKTQAFSSAVDTVAAKTRCAESQFLRRHGDVRAEWRVDGLLRRQLLASFVEVCDDKVKIARNARVHPVPFGAGTAVPEADDSELSQIRLVARIHIEQGTATVSGTRVHSVAVISSADVIVGERASVAAVASGLAGDWHVDSAKVVHHMTVGLGGVAPASHREHGAFSLHVAELVIVERQGDDTVDWPVKLDDGNIVVDVDGVIAGVDHIVFHEAYFTLILLADVIVADDNAVRNEVAVKAVGGGQDELWVDEAAPAKAAARCPLERGHELEAAIVFADHIAADDLGAKACVVAAQADALGGRLRRRAGQGHKCNGHLGSRHSLRRTRAAGAHSLLQAATVAGLRVWLAAAPPCAGWLAGGLVDWLDGLKLAG
mmetsp:Transcript_23582/g.75201  ORF Transcript_23582/g.75201 Transcript_23582/m.75201 type:complete len:465 (+) Transcript_23582:66-1460(+)